MVGFEREGWESFYPDCGQFLLGVDAKVVHAGLGYLDCIVPVWAVGCGESDFRVYEGCPVGLVEPASGPLEDSAGVRVVDRVVLVEVGQMCVLNAEGEFAAVGAVEDCRCLTRAL